MSIYFRPLPQVGPARPDHALPLAGGWTWFTHVERLQRGRPPILCPVETLDELSRENLTRPRPPLAMLDLGRPRLMGILNVTPDSFSDGGRHAATEAATRHARQMLADGADLLDIGGESTRPGARETAAEVEIARVCPTIEALGRAGVTAPISVDTRKAAVARAALAAGATILNDVSGLRFDDDMAATAAASEAPIVLMHSLGTPEIMQDLAPDAYDDVLLDIYDALRATIGAALDAGIPPSRIVVDPGIGFGKTLPQTLALLQRISLFHGLGCPVLLGVSRKGFIGRLAGIAQADRRGPASAGIGLWALSQGIQILRVHDIAVHHEMMALWQAAAGIQQNPEERARNDP